MTFQFKIETIVRISIECRVFFFNQRSYHFLVLCGIKLLVKIPTFPSTVVFKKALFQLNKVEGNKVVSLI